MEEILNSLPEPMQLNYTMFVIAGLFLALLILLNVLVFKPVLAVMSERQRRIDEGAEAQRKAQKTVEEGLTAYKTALVEARRKAQARRQEILKESEMDCSKEIASSKEKAMALVQAAATEVDQQVAQAKSVLKEDTQLLAKQIVSSVLSRSAS